MPGAFSRGGIHPALFVSASWMSGLMTDPGPVGSMNIGFSIHNGECFAPMISIALSAIGRDRSAATSGRVTCSSSTTT